MAILVSKPMPLEEELAKKVATDLAAAKSNGIPKERRASLKALRAELVVRLYAAGRTLEEIGALLGMTRERARQIRNRAEGYRGAGRPRGAPNRSEGAQRRFRERAKERRMSGRAQRMPERNAEIERLASEGLSYSEVAAIVGVSRNTVCAVMYRVKHRSDERAEGRSYPPLPRWKGKAVRTAGTRQETLA